MKKNIVYSKDGFSIENLNPQIAKIYPKDENLDFRGFDSNILILDFGKKNRGDITTCSLLFSGNIKIDRTGASCGCTTPSFQKTENGNTIVNIVFDSYKITNSVSKFVYLYVGDKQFKINLIINK
ncbi:MAG: DUF1573 domain-containing protein [Lachnospiraceae bacterium]|nr:DUF1573 domain-containing protein [Lachnospiraceae bacterium]